MKKLSLAQAQAQARGQILRWLLSTLAAIALIFCVQFPAWAALDPYMAQYLQVMPQTSIPLPLKADGTNREFDYAELLAGKGLFEQNCLSCHVGGSTIANPPISLALAALQNATPPRDTIDALVSYMRHPLAYDGSDENYYCREIADSWLDQAQVESIAGFVLRAAQTAKGWGTKDF